MNQTRQLEHAAEAITAAQALLIGAGAGMGVDSGLPDFRGVKGFWRAYPPLAKLGLHFSDMANPHWFRRDPELAWGFYGHRLDLYRRTTPHEGFAILQRWAANMTHGLFVYTSNVDGQFQKAGIFEQRVRECHGSIHYLQCTRPCHDLIWEATGIEVPYDEQSFRAGRPLPYCPKCDSLARPNILMFGDGAWIAERAEDQADAEQQWLSPLTRGELAVVECGAGTAVPSVRWHCEQLAEQFEVPLIRINPRESQGPHGTIPLAMGALEALQGIDELLTS